MVERQIVSTQRSHGLKITLTIRKPSYPKNAPVGTSITVTNVSQKAIQLPDSAGDQPIQTYVYSHETVVYPPAFPQQGVSDGPPAPPEVLKAGKSITVKPIVVLRGDVVRSHVTIVTPKYGDTHIVGKPVFITLTKSDADHVNFMPHANGQGGAHGYAYSASISPPVQRRQSAPVSSLQGCTTPSSKLAATGLGQRRREFKGTLGSEQEVNATDEHPRSSSVSRSLGGSSLAGWVIPCRS